MSWKAELDVILFSARKRREEWNLIAIVFFFAMHAYLIMAVIYKYLKGVFIKKKPESE